MALGEVTSPEPERRALVTSWLHSPHPHLLTPRAKPHLLGILHFYDTVFPLLLPSWVFSVLVLISLAMSTLRVFDCFFLGYRFELAPVFVALALVREKNGNEGSAMSMGPGSG